MALSDIFLKKGIIRFSRNTERKFFFYATLIMFLVYLMNKAMKYFT